MRRPHPRRRGTRQPVRGTWWAAGAVVATLCAVAVAGGRAGAAAGERFVVVARADVAGLDVVYSAAPLAPDGKVLFLSPATAQASFSSFGASKGFAAAPYPGPFVSSLPGTLSGFLAGQVDLPNLPIIVESDNIDGPSALSTQDGPYELTATSDAEGSLGRADLGVLSGPTLAIAAGQATAIAARTPEGAYIAHAQADTVPLELTPGLSIGSIRSSAKAVARPGTPPELTSSFRIDGLSIAGLPVGIGADELAAVDAAVLRTEPVASLLAGAGIKIEVLPSERTKTSVTSAGLRITRRVDVPEDQGYVEITLEVGRVTASSTADAFVADPVATAPPTSAADLAAGAPQTSGALLPDLSVPATPPAGEAAPAVVTPAALRNYAALPDDIYLAILAAGIAGWLTAKARLPRRLRRST